MNKKLLLIQPPIRDFYCTPQRLEPLGLEYLAASAASVGWNVTILDCLSYKKAKPCDAPASMSYLDRIYMPDDTGPFALFKRFQHFGMDYGSIQEAVARSNASVIGISSLFTPYRFEALAVAGIARNALPNATVVLGGGFPTCEPERALAEKCVDYIITGEGEGPLARLLGAIEKGEPVGALPGIGYRSEGGIRIIPPEAPQKFPQRSVGFLPERILKGRHKWIAVQAGRGCPHACAFCSSKLLYPNAFRQRSVVDVIHELQAFNKHCGATWFNFEDDNLTCNKQWVLDLCREIKKYFGERRLHIGAMNGLCAADLDTERLRALWSAGCAHLDLSLAVHTVDMQRTMGRPVATDRFVAVAREAAAMGFTITAYIIIGMPGQTVDTIAQSVRLLAGEPVLIGPSVYYPSPGTPLFDLCVRNGYIDPRHPELWRSSCYAVQTETFNRQDLVTVMRAIRLVNFLKTNATEKDIQSLARNSAAGGAENSYFEVGLDKAQTGLWLAGEVLRHKRFFAMKKTGAHQVSIEELPTSDRVFGAIFKGNSLDWIRLLAHRRTEDG